MGNPLYNKYCCGNLEVGVAILGWLGMCDSIISFFAALHAMVNARALAPENLSQDEYDNYTNNTIIFASSMLGIAVIFFFVNLALLWGANKKRPLLLLPWLVIHSIMFVLMLVGMLYLILSFMNQHYFGYVMVTLFIGSILCGMQLYFILCVSSLFEKMRDQVHNLYKVQIDSI